jgi:D-tagatose-1,6-bisphosphate aldolase subunit GatZ/KbaZ
MKLADDPHGKLSSKTIAERGAVLCEAAEEVVKEKGLERPVYILGSEVPIPGGAQTNEELTVTSKEDFLETIRFFKESFEAHKLTEAWKNVIAFVVQPGVEFGAFSVHDYEPAKAKELSAKIAEIDGIAFEGHSTDYQSEESLKELVDDHVAILKVGPALTFALREGLESLESIEKELLDGKTELSNFSQTLEKAMTDDPTNWIKHYKFGSEKNKIARKFSYSDRCRYYLGDENVEKAIDRLFKNLDGKEIPMPIISRYFPTAYWKVRSGEIKPVPRELAKARIKDTLDIYYSAVN